MNAGTLTGGPYNGQQYASEQSIVQFGELGSTPDGHVGWKCWYAFIRGDWELIKTEAVSCPQSHAQKAEFSYETASPDLSQFRSVSKP